MKQIKLENQRIQKMRDYHYISIPKAFMDNGLLSTKKKYRVIIEEISETPKEPTIQNQIETVQEETV
jgi:hypothetical protein